MPRPAEIAGGPMEEALYNVPKAQDFDPDPTRQKSIRRSSRSTDPARRGWGSF